MRAFFPAVGGGVVASRFLPRPPLLPPPPKLRLPDICKATCGHDSNINSVAQAVH